VSEASFSFHELREASKVGLPITEELTASDGIMLSFRRYTPASPRAAVLFYHGGGAHSVAGYQFLGRGLQKQFDTVVYMPDIRGHGSSGGPRGDTPCPKQVWADITTFIKHIRAEFPQLPLFLGGHSSGAGLILNYSSQSRHESVDGYFFLSPEFGFRSNTARPSQTTPFARANVPAFVLNAISGNLLCGHYHAVQFNYPSEVLASDKGMVAFCTINMSKAITPYAPHRQFATLDRTFGLWIGADDELLLPSKVLAFADLAMSVRADSQAGSIPGDNHLSILINAHKTVGPWISNMLHTKNR
jgi:pimeloyl-ACP methyl ester carboxylesterase